jgi:hypothetical protein
LEGFGRSNTINRHSDKHLDELALRTKCFSDLSERHPELICQRDDGGFQLGWGDDAPGPFPSREFAEAVAVSREGHDALAAS